jgi:hypothetical protein
MQSMGGCERRVRGTVKRVDAWFLGEGTIVPGRGMRRGLYRNMALRLPHVWRIPDVPDTDTITS